MDFRFTLENDEIIQAYLLLTNRDIPRPDCINEIQNNRLKVFLNTRFTRLKAILSSVKKQQIQPADLLNYQEIKEDS